MEESLPTHIHKAPESSKCLEQVSCLRTVSDVVLLCLEPRAVGVLTHENNLCCVSAIWNARVEPEAVFLPEQLGKI